MVVYTKCVSGQYLDLTTCSLVPQGMLIDFVEASHSSCLVILTLLLISYFSGFYSSSTTPAVYYRCSYSYQAGAGYCGGGG